jgi:hypothetical protein
VNLNDRKYSRSISHFTALILISGIISQVKVCPAQEKFPANLIKEDFKYMYNTLQASTYDLFMFTDKESIDREYDKIYNSIHDSISLVEIHRLFQSFIALADFSHCKLIFPQSSFRNFYRNGGHFFPLMICFIDNKARVLLDYSENENIAVGDELLKINGQPFESILKQMYPYLSAENEYLKRTFLEMSGLMHTYWYVFGDFDKSSIELKKSDGEIQTVQLEGVSVGEYNSFVKNNPNIPSSNNKERKLKFIGKTAYLHPGTFLNNRSRSINVSDHKTFDNEEFIHFIDSAFSEISKNNSQDLIIDIRDNSGGDNSFSDYMISYFATKAFRSASVFQLRTSKMTKSFWKEVDIPKYEKLKEQIMTLEDGERFEADLNETSPKNDTCRFKGNIYVLINRYSYSNSATAASIIQDYGFGTLIGEETSCVLSSCGGVHQFSLPNTNIDVYYPKTYSIRPNGDTSLKGVVPDYHVEHDPFTESDEALEFALELINSK